MKGPLPVGIIVRRILKEMQETVAILGGDPGLIMLWDEPPSPASLPKPRLRLLQGGKEN